MNEKQASTIRTYVAQGRFPPEHYLPKLSKKLLYEGMKIEVRYARMYKEDVKRQIAKDAAQAEWDRLQADREAIKEYQGNEQGATDRGFRGFT